MLYRGTAGAAAVEYLFVIGLLALASMICLRGVNSALATNFQAVGSTVLNSTSH